MVDIIVVANRGQYNHRIYRVIRDLGVSVKLVNNTISIEEIERESPKGIVIGGGPYLEEVGNSPEIIKKFSGRIPILGICLGHQLMAKIFGGEVRRAKYAEYAEEEIFVIDENDILKGLSPSFKAWVSHKDEVSKLPKDFVRLAYSKTCEIEAMKHKEYPLYGVQFHPEVEHTPKGREIFKNFLKICNCI